MHESSMEGMANFVATHLANRRGQALTVLDIGSMNFNGSYRALFDVPGWTYTGLDMAAGPGVDLVLDSPYNWGGVSSNAYDVVISGQAFEHIEFPWVTILEVARVLRPGGLVCIVVPSAGFEHRYPVDCWRFYPDGVRALARWADLDVNSAQTSWNPVREYSDGSAGWKDTVLIASKRLGTPRWRYRAKAALLRKTVGFQASRRIGAEIAGASPHAASAD